MVGGAKSERAECLRSLHGGDRILVLPNAWDVASARLFEAAGASAVGTTSMGIAASLGYPDIQRIPLDQMLEAVGRIADAVQLPVTADMEAGYGDTTDAVVASILLAVRAGAVGINIEDGTGDPAAPLMEVERLSERIVAIREATKARGLHLVINARTDVFLAAAVPESDRLAEAIERGNRYRLAGADCVFVPGGLDRETIAALVREIDAPLNVVANPAISVPLVPTVPELQTLGVARVSVGSGLMRASLGFIDRAARELMTRGTYDAMAAELGRSGAREAYETAIDGRRAAGFDTEDDSADE